MNFLITPSDVKVDKHKPFETPEIHLNHKEIISDENANIDSSDSQQNVLPDSSSTPSIEQDSILIVDAHDSFLVIDAQDSILIADAHPLPESTLPMMLRNPMFLSLHWH